MDAMRYNFVIYDEILLQNFLSALVKSKGKNISQVKYAYILHDKDISEETGEFKKAHYHLWLEFPTSVKSRDLVAIMNLIGLDNSALSHEKTDRKFLAYLTHNTSKSEGVKASYSREDIHTNIERTFFDEMYYEAVAKAKKPSRQQQKTEEIYQNGKSLYELVKNNPQIVNFPALMDFLYANDEKELANFVMSKPYFCEKSLKDLFTVNSQYNSAHTVKYELLQRIETLRHELYITEDIRDQLNVLEDKIEEKIDVKEWLLNENFNNKIG